MNFDFSSTPESTAIPMGEYVVVADKVEEKTTNSGTGKYFNIMWRVKGPSQANRTFFTMITTENANPTAVAIGKTQLLQLLLALGFEKDKLVNITPQSLKEMMTSGPVLVRLANKTDDYGTKEVIKSFSKLEENSGSTPSYADQPF